MAIITIEVKSGLFCNSV